MAPLVGGDRLVMAREMQELTQRELVERVGNQFTVSALSQLEQGHSRPSPATLLAIAEATRFPLDFFLARPGDPAPEGFFRSLRSTKAKDRRAFLARAALLAEFVEALEEYVRLPPRDVPQFEVDLDDNDDIEWAAEEIRTDWDLGDQPIPHVIRELERHGVVAVRSTRLRNEVDAFSVNFKDRPIVVLGSDKGVTARSRFDAAHELGHLVLHSDPDANTKEAELQAHRFASAFLMPRSAIEEQLPSQFDVRRLVELKLHWRVSMAALLIRARDLGVMTPQRYVGAIKAMSARGWRKDEPGDSRLGGLEHPVLLMRAVDRLEAGGVTVAQLCDEAGLPAETIALLLSVTADPRPSVDL